MSEEDFQRALVAFDPDRLPDGAVVLQRGRNLTVRLPLAGADAVVKRFPPPSPLRALADRLSGRLPKAERAYLAARRIHERLPGATPEPLARIAPRGGAGLLATRYEPGLVSFTARLAALYRAGGPCPALIALLERVAAACRGLHDAGFVHLDLGNQNILLAPDGRILFVDLNRGRILPATGPLPPGVDGRIEGPSPWSFDPERARALLAEAGYPGGIDPATGRRLALTLDLGSTDQEMREGAELIASFLDRVGISLSLSYSTFPQFLRRVNRREAQMFLLTWVGDYPDPLNFLQLFVSSNASPGPNRCNYASPSYDALFEEAARATDPARRAALVRAMQEEVRDACPWVFVGHRREVVLLGPRLRNYRLHDFPLGAEKHWRRAP